MFCSWFVSILWRLGIRAFWIHAAYGVAAYATSSSLMRREVKESRTLQSSGVSETPDTERGTSMTLSGMFSQNFQSNSSPPTLGEFLEDDINTDGSDNRQIPAGCDETVSGTLQDGYRGCQTRTSSGLTCQRWDADHPHHHSRNSRTYPDKGLTSNYCRNPDGEPEGIWCYTLDPAIRWQYCDPLKVLTTCNFQQLSVSGTFPQPQCQYQNFHPVCNEANNGKLYYGNSAEVGGGQASSLTTCVGGWQYHGAKTYDRSFTCYCLKACAQSVVVGGATSHLGTYSKTSLTPGPSQAGRPVYQKGGMYMFYWSAHSKWRVGSDYSSSGAWLASYHAASAQCPGDAHWGWEWTTAWNHMPITVVEACSASSVCPGSRPWCVGGICKAVCAIDEAARRRSGSACSVYTSRRRVDYCAVARSSRRRSWGGEAADTCQTTCKAEFACEECVGDADCPTSKPMCSINTCQVRPTAQPTPAPTPPVTQGVYVPPVACSNCCPSDGGCSVSSNYPGYYGNNQHCIIQVRSPGATFVVSSFSSENGFDKLWVNGQVYSGVGSQVPNSFMPTTPITWTTDFSVTRQGWRLCEEACVDADANCLAWSRDGQCTSNSAKMSVTCKQSCGICRSRTDF